MIENSPIQQTALEQEWQVLHSSFESAEHFALIIKLVAISGSLVGIICHVSPVIMAFLLLIIWLQEAIWKTFQGRTEQRLMLIEQALLPDAKLQSFQFYSQWSASRPGTVQLVSEYLKNALRPTIAYPYAVLIIIGFIIPFF